VVTVALSFVTKPADEEKLKGLVYCGAAQPKDPTPWYQTPEFYAVVVVVFFVALNIAFF